MLSLLMSNTDNPAQWTGEIQTPGHYCWSTAYLLQPKINPYLGRMKNSAGLRMRDLISKSAVAWICVDLRWGNSANRVDRVGIEVVQHRQGDSCEAYLCYRTDGCRLQEICEGHASPEHGNIYTGCNGLGFTSAGWGSE